MKLLLPLILLLIGVGAGAGAGFFLRPAPPVVAEETEAAPSEAEDEEEDQEPFEFVKLNNQFIVPVVENERVSALVVLSLSLEVDLGERAFVYQMEPKLRDAFLGVMFDHANSGGFHGMFTESTKMTALRIALIEVARKTLGTLVHDVLIIDLVRQDT